MYTNPFNFFLGRNNILIRDDNDFIVTTKFSCVRFYVHFLEVFDVNIENSHAGKFRRFSRACESEFHAKCVYVSGCCKNITFVKNVRVWTRFFSFNKRENMSRNNELNKENKSKIMFLPLWQRFVYNVRNENNCVYGFAKDSTYTKLAS